MKSGMRDKTNRLYYFGLFALFGVLIAFCTSFFTYRLELIHMETKLTEDAKDVFALKVDTFESYTAELKDIVEALRDTSLLYTYLETPGPDTYDAVAACFLAVANSNPSLMQVRYLDEFGVERVRVNRPAGRLKGSLVPESELQDKKGRYYFQEASKLPPSSFWYSKLDLNIENGVLDIPENPVLRLASPVYVGQTFRGIVIINVHMEGFLEEFLQSSLFDISLVDREGYYLVSHDRELSWSRYRKTEFLVGNVYPEYADAILHHVTDVSVKKYDRLFVGSFVDLLEKDGAILLLHAGERTVESMKVERQKAAALIISIIALFSIPLALLISNGPAKLHRKIYQQNRKLAEAIDLIDKNVHRGTLDLERNFQDASSALAGSLGVAKSEMAGMKYDALYCARRPKEYYDEVWECLQRDGHWRGELEHSRSNGECYWADTVVFPKMNDDGLLVGYSVIYQDITDKKRIEELSITDELTGLHNRRFFNVMIRKEISRAQREQKNIVFAMVDIDFFKQYNDNYGHQKGDEVLRQVSAVMGGMLSRGGDYCFRLGGEEFGLLFTNQESNDSFMFVDSIRQAIEELGIEHRWSAIADVVTVSIGMFTVGPEDVVSVDTLYGVADEALYSAKNGGRNRVFVGTIDAPGNQVIEEEG